MGLLVKYFLKVNEWQYQWAYTSGVSHPPFDNSPKILSVKIAVYALVRKPFASSFSCSAGKGNQYLHWACQQMKTWSALKVSARSLLDNHEQHRQMTRHQKSSQFTETSWQRSLINWSHLGVFSISIACWNRNVDVDVRMLHAGSLGSNLSE